MKKENSMLTTIVFIISCVAQQKELSNVSRDSVVVSGHKLGEVIDKNGIDSLTTEFDPMIDEDTLFHYYFGKSYYDVLNDVIVGFKIEDNNLELEFVDIKVGDDKEVLLKEYPASFSQRYSPEVDREIVRIGIVGEFGLTDSFIHFEMRNGIITSIYYWEDY